MGKLVTPATVAPPPPPSAPSFDPTSLSTGHSGHSGAFRARRRGTPAAVWAVIGLGVVAVGALIVVLATRTGDDETADKPKDKSANRSADKSTAKNAADEKGSANAAGKKDDDAPKRSDAKTGGSADKPLPSPNEKPVVKPGEEPVSPAVPPTVAVKEFRGIEEVPIGERPASLDTVISDSVALLEAGKFDEFFATHVDPRDRGATPPAVGRRRRDDLPYDVLAQGTDNITRILAGIGKRMPHLFEDGTIAVFDLAPRTRPTFVEHEGKWYLSRGLATSMKRRFANLTEEQEIIYLLEITSGEPAVGPADAQRDGTEQGVIEQLLQLGAYVALSHPDQEYRRSAVMITNKFEGSDDGLALLGQLSDRSQMVALVVDGMSGANITEEIGLLEFDGLTYLEYLRFVNTPVLRHPVSIHFADMSRLKTLTFDGGDQVGDIQISDHLRKCAELKRLSIEGDRISDSTLERFKKFTLLESLELNVPSGSITPAAVANLRKSMPGLWVEY